MAFAVAALLTNSPSLLHHLQVVAALVVMALLGAAVGIVMGESEPLMLFDPSFLLHFSMTRSYCCKCCNVGCDPGYHDNGGCLCVPNRASFIQGSYPNGSE